MSGIFLNYRTIDQSLGAVLLDNRLSERFGEEQVFRDARSLPIGEDFAGVLWSRLRTSDVVLALIGPHWLARDAAGRRLIDDKRDFIRRELTEALSLRIRTVPVLFGGATLPAAKELPKKLRPLVRHQFMEIRARDPEPDIDRLIARLGKLIHKGPRSPSNEKWGVFVAGDVKARRDVVLRDKIVGREDPP
jgi:hypothetical protein